jgi:hypothetical protein
MFGRSQRPERITSRLGIESLETRRLLAADLVALSPVDGATTVSPDGNLTLTFSDDVRPGPGVGRILIKNAADDSVVESLSLSDPARVTFSGHAVTLDPLNSLPSNAQLYVTIDAGAIRDVSTKAAEQVIFREDFETAHLIDSELDQPQFENYALFMNGVLDVQTAGNYRFGMATTSGGYIAIDLNGDGQANVNDPADRVVFANTIFGGIPQYTEQAISLTKGQYKFETLYFDDGGWTSGEFFYAVDTGPLIPELSEFAIVGNGSRGIAVTTDLITATTYAAAPGTTVDGIQAALNLRAGIGVEAGYPIQGKFSVADARDSSALGYFSSDNQHPPRLPPVDPSPHNYIPNMPAGWTKQTNLPQSQPVYNGWTQLDKSFWIAQQGDQGRLSFELGQGTIAVMDPDAFDDFSPIPDHSLEGYTTLPAIDLTDIAANSVKLKFDSSFRPEQARYDEDHPDWIGQTALLDVSFDGGASWENLLLQNTVTAGGVGSLDHANEHLTLSIPNPAGRSLLVRFGLVNATNDWWWAIDNMEITGNALGDLYEGIADRTTWNFTTLPEPLAADFNGDGQVDLNDFGILKQNFATGDTKAEGDANGDAKVDLTDFGILKVLISLTPAPAAAAGDVFAPPDLSALSPPGGMVNVSPNVELALLYTADVRPGPGAGRILIRNAATGQLIEALDVHDSERVKFSGPRVLLVPTAPLPANANIYITVDAGAIRDLSTEYTEGVIFRENFETSHPIDSKLDTRLQDGYAVTMEGILNVSVGGTFTFGGRGAIGQYLAIDRNGDGQANIDDPADLVFRNPESRNEDELESIVLEAGNYRFEYAFAGSSGQSGGELFYAPGQLTTFDSAKFAVVGDPSQGIGLAESKLAATTYRTAESSGSLTLDELARLRSGELESAVGFPIQASLPFADVWNYGPSGHYTYDARPAGAPTDSNPFDYDPNLPVGWSKQTNLPQPRAEFDGWVQLSKEFWLAEQGGQDRDRFSRGQGVVAVIDPDAFDDYSTINDGVEPEHNLEGYLTLPPINLSDVAADSVKLSFDSSFRPESAGNTDLDHPTWIGQTGLLDVSFDNGATWQNVLLKNSLTDGPDGTLDHVDERLEVALPNPGSGAMLIRFGLVNAQNNWWWAIDNIVVTARVLGTVSIGIADRTTWPLTTGPETLTVDFNGDGLLNLADFGVLKQGFGIGNSFAQGDANSDAKVNLTDFGLLKTLLNASPPAAAAVPSEAQSAAAMHLAFAEVVEAADEGDETGGLDFA